MIEQMWNPILLMSLSLGIGILNISLLVALLYSYWKTYQEVKSDFTVGLIIFASFLLLQNLISTFFLIFQFNMPPGPPIPELNQPRMPLSFINLVQLVALLILFKLTRK
jgi:hypothetical protein